jgi:hypothetical protein
MYSYSCSEKNTQRILINVAIYKYGVSKPVELRNGLNLYLSHYTRMFDKNYKSYVILSWNLNILRKLFVNNINYRYTCIVGHRIKNKNKVWKFVERV